MVILLFTGKRLVKISPGSFFLLYIYVSIYDVQEGVSFFRTNSRPSKWVHSIQNLILHRVVILLFTGKRLVKISCFVVLARGASFTSISVRFDFIFEKVVRVRFGSASFYKSQFGFRSVRLHFQKVSSSSVRFVFGLWSVMKYVRNIVNSIYHHSLRTK